MFTKRLFYASAAILCLALSYHFGARNVGAQGAAFPIVGLGNSVSGFNITAVNSNGDFYGSYDGITWVRLGNINGGGATPAQRESFGSVKARYR